MKRNLITNEYWSKDADEAILFNKIVTSLNAWKEAFDEGDYDQYAHEYDENVSAWYNRSVVLTGSAEHANEGAYRNVYGISRRHESISKNPKSLYTPAKHYKAQKIAISLFRLFFNRKRVSCLGRSGAVPWSRPHVPLQGNTRYSGVFQGTMHLAIAPPVLHESQLPANII